MAPSRTVNYVFGITGAAADKGATAATILESDAFNPNCLGATPSYAADNGITAPGTELPSGQSISTVAIYPLPAAVAESPSRRGHLGWTAQSLGASVPLGDIARSSAR
jgi:hypothetical protein